MLTLVNLFLFITRKGISTKLENQTDFLVFFLGIPLTNFYWDLVSPHDWDYQYKINASSFIPDGVYTPISFDYLLTFFVLCCLGFVGYFLLRTKKDRLPPLVAAFSHSAVLIGIVLSVVFIMQFIGSVRVFFLIYPMLLPINYILCSIRMLKSLTVSYSEKFNEENYKSRFMKYCCRVLGTTAGYITFAFVLIIPIMCIVVCVLMLFGQKPDSVVRMFTETAEWHFSQKRPPLRYPDEGGHYLCTAAARGDKEVVKPIRLGKRHGDYIVVNRQLLVANAFEDLIRDKTPRFHKFIRYIYDKYGYPISKHITTPKRCNFVYILMKPLEWLFVFILYTFDSSPESRIAIQYTGKNWRDNKIV